MSSAGFELLADLVGDGGVTVLSGAGLSTESGIPDYRGPAGPPRPAPMTVQTFLATAAARRRYWARSSLGWPRLDQARPNAGHHAVTALQAQGLLAGIITQNVDGLHSAAGSSPVLELHGTLAGVRCVACRDRTDRRRLQDRLTAANRGWRPAPAATNPDGDVELAEESLRRFRVVDCERCGGILTPDVVLFGDTVPRDRVDRAFALVESSGCLLVLGSSLTVMSGYRFVRRAAALGIPVAIVNQGQTRGDELALVRLDARLGAVLPALVDRLSPAISSA